MTSWHPWRAYLFSYKPLMWRDGAIKQIVNSTPEIGYWMHFLPNAYILISNLSATDLAARLRQQLNDSEWFIVTRLDPQATDGWLPQEAWDRINNPRTRA